MRRKGRVGHLVSALLLGLGVGHAAAAQQEFWAEGSDTIFAMGARHIAMGGTGTATADDALAVFYNPARLSLIDRPNVAISRQLDAELRPYAFAGAVVPLDFLAPLGIDASFGFARYNRVHARSKGAFTEDDPRSVFLRYLLPGISGTFDGDIDSKTLVNRFALGLAPQAIEGLSIGVNIDWIDCKSTSCGVQSGSATYQVRSAHATALSYGISANWQVTDRVTLAAAVTDIDVVLDVDTMVTDASGSRPGHFTAKLPSQGRVEAAWQATDRLLLAAGYQRIWGDYGDVPFNIEILNFGAEYALLDHLTARAGAWVPLAIEAGDRPPIQMPVPAVPTAGLAVSQGGFRADFALFMHPMMSYSANAPWPSSELTLSWSF